MHETTFLLFKIAAPPSAPAPAPLSRIPADPGGMLMLGTALNSFSISSSVKLALLARAAMLAHWWLRFVHKGSASKFLANLFHTQRATGRKLIGPLVAVTVP